MALGKRISARAGGESASTDRSRDCEREGSKPEPGILNLIDGYTRECLMDLRKWLVDTGAKTLYIEPGSPWENRYCESFNSKPRDEFLYPEIFHSIKQLRVLAERWRVHYNTVRPNSSLGYKPAAPGRSCNSRA